MMVRKALSPNAEVSAIVAQLLERERQFGLHTLAPYENFRRGVFEHRDQLVNFVAEVKKAGQSVFGYGASTKGNVILQFCGFSQSDIPCIAEINPDKFGCVTPGTLIPIVSEHEVKLNNPDFMLVMPWHFREYIVSREKDYLARGGKLIFPLPSIEIESI